MYSGVILGQIWDCVQLQEQEVEQLSPETIKKEEKRPSETDRLSLTSDLQTLQPERRPPQV